MAKGVAHAGKGKSLSSGEANENERRGWSEKSYRQKNKNPTNNYDWSRRLLNFEVKDGRIIPLCSQPVSLYDRYLNLLGTLGFKQYKDAAANQQHTYVEIILSGSTEPMQKLAFGNQAVDYTRNPEQWRNWNVKRMPDIEEWALDTYAFACRQYGKENIIGFEVHLDETEPHVHLNLVPTAVMKQRGNVSGYVKIDADGNPVTYQKGKHVGKVIKISDKKYETLSDEKKKQYRKNERGTVRTISFATYFGSSFEERSKKMSELHDEFYKQVGKKWGFERGDVIASLPEEERKKRKHLTKAQAYEQKQAELAKQNAIRERDKVLEDVQTVENELLNVQAEKAEAENERDQAVKEAEKAKKNLQTAKRDAEEGMKNVTVKLTAKKKELETVEKNLEKMAAANNTRLQAISEYVKDIGHITFVVPKDMLRTFKSPLKEHPRIAYSNPPLTVKELDEIAHELEMKVLDGIGPFTSKKEARRKCQEIQTDKQTILREVVSNAQMEQIRLAEREHNKEVRRQIAEATVKVKKYDELVNDGCSKEAWRKAKGDAEKLQPTLKMLNFAWPNLSKAMIALLGEDFDKKEKQEIVIDCLREKPKERIDDMIHILDYVSWFKKLDDNTIGKALCLSTDTGAKEIAKNGYDIAANIPMELADRANEMVATTVCLFYGYTEAAMTVSSNTGGGGGDSVPESGWGRRPDEDDENWARRCFHMARTMMCPAKGRAVGQSTRRWNK